MDWKNLTRIQNDLKITDNLDIRFLKVKLKEFERKKLVECKDISEEKHYKCINDLQGLEKKEILTKKRPTSKKKSVPKKRPLSKEQLVPIKKTSENTNKISLKQHNSAKHTILVGEKEQLVDNKEHLFCGACNKKLKSNSEFKNHQKTKDHLYNTELIALMQKHYGNIDIYKDSISYIKTLNSKRLKQDKTILIRNIISRIEETGDKKMILDLYKLGIKFNRGNSRDIEYIGDLYAELEDYKNAILTYKKALAKTNRKSLIQSKLRGLYFKIGDHENAFKSIKHIAPVGPHKSQTKFDSLIKRDWNRLKSEIISKKMKLPVIPKEVLDDKIKEFKQCDRQYIFWYLNAPSTSNELAILKRYMNKINAKFMHEIDSILHYRIFYNDNSTSIHIKAIKKDWGIIINMHRDLFKHQHTIFDQTCLELLSKLYLFLKKKRRGNRFLLPRQEKRFQSYLGYRFNEKVKYRR